jgi:hypothetical protein
MKERTSRRTSGILASVVILIVLSSIFPGGDMLARQAVARNNDSFRMTAATLSEDDNDDSNTSSFDESRDSSESIDQIYRSLRSKDIQSEIRTASAENKSTSLNDLDKTKGLQTQQTPIIGHFSATYSQEFTTTPGVSGHLTGKMEGDMSSVDGRFYSPIGTWKVSFDYLHMQNGVIDGLHSYTGNASTVNGGGPHFVVADPSHGFIEYDAATNTFALFVLAVDTEVNELQMFAPTVLGAGHPLSGSDSAGESTASWTFTPGPVCQQGSGSPQITQAGTQCKPSVKARGNVLLQTPPTDRGNIFIPDLKVELCSAAVETNCPAATFTDKAGNYELSTDKLKKEDTILQITFLNKDGQMFVTQYPNNEPAKIRIPSLPFVSDVATGESVADVNVRFSNTYPYIFVDNIPGGPPVTTINVDKNYYIATLVSVFYYTDRSLQFSKSTLPIAINYNLPLKVKINSPIKTLPTSFQPLETTIYFDGLQSLYIISDNQNKVEVSLDTLFHEFGHFLNFEIFRGLSPRDKSLNPAYLAAAKGNDAKEDCHNGYAQLDSSCAMDEGKAIFFAALLEYSALDDSNHNFYKASSVFYNLDLGKGFYLEDTHSTHNIAGDKQFKKPPYFQHNGQSEELAIASLLWDLFDNTPFEPLEPVGGLLGTDQVNLELNDLINSLIFAKTTSEYYLNLISLKVVDEGLLDAVFANHGVCVDTNNDGDCKRSEVIAGFSTWKVKYKGVVYGYPYPGYKFPGGRP